MVLVDAKLVTIEDLVIRNELAYFVIIELVQIISRERLEVQE